MNTNELIEALDVRYGNPLAKDCELIQEAIKVLRLQSEEYENGFWDAVQYVKTIQSQHGLTGMN